MSAHFYLDVGVLFFVCLFVLIFIFTYLHLALSSLSFDKQAQQLWCVDLVALWHIGS